MELLEQKTKKPNWFKRHKVLTVVLGIALLLIIVSAASGGSQTKSKTASDSKPASTTKKTESVAGLNTAVRDGKFEFTVSKVECGATSVGSQYLNKTAQGQFCELSVSVKNIGNEAQSLFSGNQYLLNAAGQKYSADDTATAYAAPDSSTWYSNINPGNTVSGVIVFDIPKDQTPAVAFLHDSAYSGGVKVKLN